MDEVEQIIDERIRAYIALNLDNPSSLGMLHAIGLAKPLHDRLEPIVANMDKYGGHGMSVRQLVRNLVHAEFTRFLPRPPCQK